MGGDHDETWPIGLAAEHREQLRQLDRRSGRDDAAPVPSSCSDHCSGSDSSSRMSSNASQIRSQISISGPSESTYVIAGDLYPAGSA
jgi:hypothetical protein